MKHFYKVSIVVFVGIFIIGVVGCDLIDNDSGSPTSPVGDARQLAGYAQMPGGSTTVNIDGEDHQLNVVVAGWASLPYGNWLYVEINQQRGTGKDPGVDQVPVQLKDVEFRISGFPAEATEVVVAVREPGSADDAPFTEIWRFPVVDGVVVIPVDYWVLIHSFGSMHFSVWFQVLGGENEQGVEDITIEVSGRIGGQSVVINKEAQIGTHKPKPPAPTTTTAPAPAGISGSKTGECGKEAIWDLNPDGSLTYVKGRNLKPNVSYDRIINNTGKTLTFKCVNAAKCSDGVVKPGGDAYVGTETCPPAAGLTWVEASPPAPIKGVLKAANTEVKYYAINADGTTTGTDKVDKKGSCYVEVTNKTKQNLEMRTLFGGKWSSWKTVSDGKLMNSKSGAPGLECPVAIEWRTP